MLYHMSVVKFFFLRYIRIKMLIIIKIYFLKNWVFELSRLYILKSKQSLHFRSNKHDSANVGVHICWHSRNVIIAKPCKLESNILNLTVDSNTGLKGFVICWPKLPCMRDVLKNSRIFHLFSASLANLKLMKLVSNKLTDVSTKKSLITLSRIKISQC